MTTSWTGAAAAVSRRRRRSYGESAQLLMTPSSAQTLHRHAIGAGGSRRAMVIRPGQGRRAGRRRHGSALVHGSPAPSPAVAARTMVAEVLCEATRGTGDVVGQVQEMI